jgi:hypothetical protein
MAGGVRAYPGRPLDRPRVPVKLKRHPAEETLACSGGRIVFRGLPGTAAVPVRVTRYFAEGWEQEVPEVSCLVTRVREGWRTLAVSDVPQVRAAVEVPGGEDAIRAERDPKDACGGGDAGR